MLQSVETMDAPAPAYLSVNQFCVLYAIARSSAYRELAAGRLAAVKRGARTLIARAEGERWAATLPAFRSGVGNGPNRPCGK